MKKIVCIAIAACSALLFTQCNKGNTTDPGNNPKTNPNGNLSNVSVKGRIASVVLPKTAHSQSAQKTGGTGVQQVLVYRDFGDADLSPVDSSGNFSVSVERKPCGLVFLDGSNAVAGYLSLGSGLEALPLMMVDGDVAQINMQDIAIRNGVGTPQHNPISSGGEAEMTADELAAYKLQSTLFSTIIRNLDMNADGVLDVLSDRPYWMMFGADFAGGVAATSDPGDSGALPVLNVFHFNFCDHTVVPGSTVADLQTPDASHFTNHEAGLFTFPGATAPSTMYHWVLQGTGWNSFIAGSYTITYDAGKHVTFGIDHPMNSDNYITAAHLWYETTGTKITKVHWKWRMLNGSSVNAARLIQKDVGLQFSSGLTALQNYHITSADTECAVDVDMTSVQQILLGCNDLFGNWQPTFYAIQ